MLRDSIGRFVLVATLVGYLLFVGLSLADAEELGFIWPYPLLLALQTWVEPDTLISLLAGCFVGLLVALSWAAFLVRMARAPWWSHSSTQLIAIVASIAPFLIMFHAVLSQGYSTVVDGLLMAATVGAFVSFFLWRKRAAPIQLVGPGGIVASFASWSLPLLTLQGITMLVMRSLGYPVGE